ncbi:uncharacterized protein LOC131230588 [Magnolia sinica]|uniref:uncharacterized protein LOC131230588 n=1 Tax=Magnolia sinica TaxID=86752 RepID=UPI0026588FFB|nr:uncharacterized protein LOC131230588 [Magnolia sinica]
MCIPTRRPKLGADALERIKDLKALDSEERSWKTLLQPERLLLSGLDSAITEMAEARPILRPPSKMKALPRSETRPPNRPKTVSKAKEQATPAVPTEVPTIDLEEGAEAADVVAEVAAPDSQAQAAPEPQVASEPRPVAKQVPGQKEEQRGEPSGGEMTQQEAFFQQAMSDMFAPCLLRASLDLAEAQNRAADAEATWKRTAEAEAQLEAAMARVGRLSGELGLARKVTEDVKAECTHVASLLKEAQEESRQIRQAHASSEDKLARLKAETRATIEQAKEEARDQAVKAFLESQEYLEERDRLYQDGYTKCVEVMKEAFLDLDLSRFEEGASGFEGLEAEAVGFADVAAGIEVESEASPEVASEVAPSGGSS